MGAGRAGETLARSLLHDPSSEYRPVGFIDDDPDKKGRDVHGIRVVGRLFERHRPDVVFHAAAYKQVPMLESHVREAVRVNTLGTQTVARAAAAHADVDCFVLVSSDKAVNPVNAMGASKRLAEMVCRAVDDASASTRFVAVRFGNVLDSAGSVVPLFREQVASGGPVTVTHRDMERYFMTIPEACQLIMASATLGTGGRCSCSTWASRCGSSISPSR